ncbi:AAA family ATPase [Clostridium sp. 1001275B_160808_H3]|uniref:AAA family ATPase n=1 Tax=Clostridium sp. 1001275B_160808_H3 TaxID=2787110 RepID=UPI001899257F|nr:AAA family ATPase [Clostridium sp. 1001275B_160808_H3]
MKILIFGIVASGKTTLSRELSLKYNIQCYEGDSIAWGDDWEERYKRSDSEQLNRILEIDKIGHWIIEGTYRESQKCLFDMADKIIFLDTPLHIRRVRIITRFLKQRFGIEKCNYNPTFEMLKNMYKWTNDFERKRDKYEKMLLSYEDKLIRIKSVKELDRKFIS